MYEDFTGLPDDFRTMLETARQLDNLHKQLPEQLARLPITELMALTPADAKRILAPVATPTTPTGEPPK